MPHCNCLQAAAALQGRAAAGANTTLWPDYVMLERYTLGADGYTKGGMSVKIVDQTLNKLPHAARTAARLLLHTSCSLGKRIWKKQQAPSHYCLQYHPIQYSTVQYCTGVRRHT
jgi:hypothetical protein